MKLLAFILLVPMIMALPSFLSVQTWLASFQQPLVNLIDNPLRRSTIPQFILDTRHPWIVANRRKLERLPNAEAFLCSMPNTETNESNEKETEAVGGQLEIPPDVFDNLEIDNNREGISRPGWPNALERLGEMKRCPRALNQVKTLDVTIFVHSGKYCDWYLKSLEPSQPPEQLLTLFGDVLESMTNLTTLNWGIDKEDAHYFEAAFKSRNLTLPSIKTLVPGPWSEYLVSMCPNLERLENGGSFNWYHAHMPDNRDWKLLFIQAAVSAPKLKRFAMVGGSEGWTPSYVSEVIRVMPQIESLGLYGSLGPRNYPREYDDEGERLTVLLDLLSQLKNLTHLDLPNSSELGVGFDGGPKCGNPYLGKGGNKYRRQVTRKGAEATERGGDIVVAKLPHLTCLTIGGARANITQSEGKIVNVTWPWTGKMNEWLMDMVPEEN